MMTDDVADSLVEEFRHYCHATEFTATDRGAVRARIKDLRLPNYVGHLFLLIIERMRVDLLAASSAGRDDSYREAIKTALAFMAAARQGEVNVQVRADSRSEAASRSKSQMGDDIKIGGDVTQSAVGSSASFKGRDVASYKSAIQSSAIDSDVKDVLIRAKEQLESANLPAGEAEDASDDLAKLTAELEKPEKDTGRIAKLWGRIRDVAPTVAQILAGAASIAKLIGAVHCQ